MKYIKIFEDWRGSSSFGARILDHTLIASLFYKNQEDIEDLTGETLKEIDEEWGDYFLGEFTSDQIDMALRKIGIGTVEELTDRYYLADGEPLQNLSFPRGEDWVQPKDLLPALLDLKRMGFKYWGGVAWSNELGMAQYTVFSKRKHQVGDISMDRPIDSGLYYRTWWEGGWEDESEDPLSGVSLN